MLYLKKPDMGDYAEFCEMMSEWEQSGESVIPSVMTLYQPDFREFLRVLVQLEEKNYIPFNFAPATLFVLTDETGKIFGASHLRHFLTNDLRVFGGHIGYGIRPSERGKGLGVRQLELTLEKAREAGLRRVLVSCDTRNVHSDAVIRHCGGVLEFEGICDRHPDVPINRYWIIL